MDSCSVIINTSSRPQRLTVYGLNLQAKYETLMIIEHKIPFIQKIDDWPGLIPESKPRITAIMIVPVEREKFWRESTKKAS